MTRIRQRGCVVATLLLGAISWGCEGPLESEFTAPVIRADQAGSHGVVSPVDGEPYGKSYGEWGAAWWIWAASIPATGHPLRDETGAACGTAQSGPVWFLVGTDLGGTLDRSCTVPPGKALFFPIVNVIFSNIGEDPPLTDDDLMSFAAFFGSAAGNLEATIDGVSVEALESFHVQSGAFDLSFPEDNILGAPAAGTSRAADDGVYLMVPPLPVGKHTIHFAGALIFTEDPFGFDFVFELDITYHLTVAP